jgi:hypothetical protein
MKRLEAEPGVKPIQKAQDIVDIVRHAMEALQPEPRYPAGDKQLVFDELATILDFLG